MVCQSLIIKPFKSGSLIAQLVQNRPAMQDLIRFGSIPGSGRSAREGKGYTLQYSGLENSNGLYSPWGLRELDTTERLSLSKVDQQIQSLEQPYVIFPILEMSKLNFRDVKYHRSHSLKDREGIQTDSYCLILEPEPFFFPSNCTYVVLSQVDRVEKPRISFCTVIVGLLKNFFRM